MHQLWAWLLEGTNHATAILVVITAIYAFLTWRMARAIARQTRAMIQPVAQLHFHWNQRTFHPESCFEIKNVGAQPLLLLDVNLWCGLHRGMRIREFTEHYTLWDEHIIPPGGSLRPTFNFKDKFDRQKLQWDCDCLSYSLDIVVSDISKQVVLRYKSLPVQETVNVSKGMPLSLRWRYAVKRFSWRFPRLRHQIDKFKKRKPHGTS